eukprot:SAG31_NODE_5468_length_2521_cov_8.738233_2_plen_229_part_00
MRMPRPANRRAAWMLPLLMNFRPVLAVVAHAAAAAAAGGVEMPPAALKSDDGYDDATGGLGQTVHVQPWGANAVRLQVFPGKQLGNISSLGYLQHAPRVAATTEDGNRSNIHATVDANGLITVTRPSDGATLLSQTAIGELRGTAGAAGRGALSMALQVAGTHHHRFYGGGCRCGGGLAFGNGAGGGRMLNAGRNGTANTSRDLHWGALLGNLPTGPTQGGISAQCGA